MRPQYIVRSQRARRSGAPNPAPKGASATVATHPVWQPVRFLKPLIVAFALAALGAMRPAAAQKPPAPPTAATEIGALMQAGRSDEALRRADARLKENPRDAQVRFMRGVILADQGKTVEAALVFEALIQEFPELPEPYNNLAAIHATQGRYDSAMRLLQQALAAQPNYVTAYENLGDLYLSMAEQAYGQAIALDSGREAAKAKLETARELNQRIRAIR